jgi:hypothetical protein
MSVRLRVPCRGHHLNYYAKSVGLTDPQKTFHGAEHLMPRRKTGPLHVIAGIAHYVVRGVKRADESVWKWLARWGSSGWTLFLTAIMLVLMIRQTVVIEKQDEILGRRAKLAVVVTKETQDATGVLFGVAVQNVGAERPMEPQATLMRALAALVPALMLFVGSLALFMREKVISSVLQLIGAGCLVVVVLAHVCETIQLFPAMGWGA